MDGVDRLRVVQVDREPVDRLSLKAGGPPAEDVRKFIRRLESAGLTVASTPRQ
jgi:hypothetical protein